jgi:hypothetical protein
MPISHVLRALLAAALLALAAAAGASASSTQVTVMQDDDQLFGHGDNRGKATLDEMKALGADVVKIRIGWRYVVPKPGATKKPSGFQSENPAEYPHEYWERIDNVVIGTVARGMRPYILIGGPAPDWASGKTPVDRPDPKEYGKFAQAVGTRYSGSYGGGPLPTSPPPLPRVTIFSLMNEPNLFSWLTPQQADGRPASPHIYRKLLRAGNSGLNKAGHNSSTLLFGELLPYARSGEAGRRKTRPLDFLRELACVDSSYKPFKGRKARERGCKGFEALPGDGIAYHPYTLPGGPDVKTPNRSDASISELGRVTQALDKLSNRNRFKKNRLPLWITEFGYQTDPPDQYQTPIKRVPGFLGQAEWLAFRNPRVVSYAQYPLVDDKKSSDGGGFQSGLRTRNRNKKKLVYAAFKAPFFVQRRSASSVEIFGGVRAGASGEKVTIQSKKGRKGDWKTLKNGKVALGPGGYFDKIYSLSGADKRQYRFRYSAGKSRTATAHR